MLKKTALFILIFLFTAVCPLQAEEILVRLANLDSQALQSYQRTGFNLFTREVTYTADLERALDAGVIEKDRFPGKNDISENMLKPFALSAVSGDIQSLVPFQARVSGRKARSGRSAWQKYILNFPKKLRYDQALFEVMTDNSTFAAEKVSHIAVKDQAGRFVSWEIIDDPFSDRVGSQRVLRMKRTAFLQKLWQKSGLDWLIGLMPPNEILTVIILDNSGRPGIDRFSDSVLLFINPVQMPPGGSGLTDMSIVIGWTAAGSA